MFFFFFIPLAVHAVSSGLPSASLGLLRGAHSYCINCKHTPKKSQYILKNEKKTYIHVLANSYSFMVRPMMPEEEAAFLWRSSAEADHKYPRKHDQFIQETEVVKKRFLYILVSLDSLTILNRVIVEFLVWLLPKSEFLERKLLQINNQELMKIFKKEIIQDI